MKALEKNKILYNYSAEINKDCVVDGDTLKNVIVDLGFRTKIKIKYLRLYGVDTPEKHGKTKANGLASKDFVIKQIELGNEFIVSVYKTDSFGRWIANVAIDGIDLSRNIILSGFGNPYFGGKKK